MYFLHVSHIAEREIHSTHARTPSGLIVARSGLPYQHLISPFLKEAIAGEDPEEVRGEATSDTDGIGIGPNVHRGKRHLKHRPVLKVK